MMASTIQTYEKYVDYSIISFYDCKEIKLFVYIVLILHFAIQMVMRENICKKFKVGI